MGVFGSLNFGLGGFELGALFLHVGNLPVELCFVIVYVCGFHVDFWSWGI